MLSNNKCFILRGYSGKYFNFMMKEVGPDFYEIIVYCEETVGIGLKLEFMYLL